LAPGQLWLAIDSNLRDVAFLAGAAYQVSIEANFDAATAEQIRICIAEVANNAIEHAYGNQSGHVLALMVSVLPDRLRFEFVDRGEPFDSELLEGTLEGPEFDVADLDSIPTRGMGLFIIRSTMDTVAYQYQDGENHFVMEKATQAS
jgi:serine/threonine-protein kinase RsbW